MKTFEVRVCTTDWCGYESYYTIEAESEDEAIAKAESEFVDEWDLLADGNGMFGEYEDFDEDGDEIEEDSLTSITATIIEDTE